MQRNTPKDYAIALYKSTDGVGTDELKNILKQFTAILFRAGQIKQLDKIIVEFLKYDKRQSGIMDVEITSARPLTAKLITEIKKAFGKKVDAIEKIDAELIGGIKIRTENKIFDASLRRQLQILKQHLS